MRLRRERARRDRLAGLDDLEEIGPAHLEMSDQIALAFLVVLQRLTPAERAVLLLRGAFDLDQTEVASVLRKSEAACCQLLRHARANIATERRVFESSREEHRRLLRAFVQACSARELDRVIDLLAEDATCLVDTGPEGRRGRCIHDVGRPIVGAREVAALLASVAREEPRSGTIHECMLNGQPAILYLRDGQPSAAILISVADGRIRHIFVQTDSRRLGQLGPLH
jgi:RNA polymerase sigma-70 factor (ECF subfamily)